MPTVYDYRQYYPYGPSGGTPRPLSDHFDDSINIKDYARSDGVGHTPGIENFVTKLISGYIHTGPNVSALARAGRVPSGIYEGDAIAVSSLIVGHSYTIVLPGTTNFLLIGAASNDAGTNFVATGVGTGTGTARPLLRSQQYSWTLGGAGPVSQLRDLNIELDHNRCNVQNVHLINTGNIVGGGAGVDIRSGTNFVFNVDVNSKDFGIKNTTAFNPGGFSSSNTVLGGWLRSNRIGVASAQNDLRLAFVRIADSLECGIDYFDQGGVHYIGCNVGTLHGPALRFRGKSFSFTGDTVADSATISNVSDFSEISIDDVITSGAIGINVQWNTRVVAIDQGAGTITVAPPMISTNTALLINIRNLPVESFFVNNTFNCPDGANFLVSQIQSIVSASAGASILVTFTQPHWGVVLNESRCRITGTGIVSYDDQLTFAEKIVEAIPAPNQVQINYPYSGTPYTAPAPISFIGDLTVGSTIITGIASTAALVVDMAVTIPTPGHGLPWSAKITAKTANTVTLSVEATLTRTGVSFTAGPAFSVLGFNMEVISEGNNAWVKDQFFVGNNSNFISMQGGLDFNLIGMRIPGKLYMDGVRPFLGTRTIGSAVVTGITIPTSEIRVGLPLTGTGIPVGTVVQSVDSPTQVTMSKVSTAASATTIRSPYTPNYLFHLPVITSATASDADVIIPQGPGSLVGWGQNGMFPIAGKSALATEGSYYVGGRVPYTQGGMSNGQPDELNSFGVTNTGFRWRTRGISYDVQGNSFKVGGGEIIFEENTFNDQSVGVVFAPTGRDMYTTTRAYLNTGGTTYGNAVHRFDAPRLETLAGETGTMGYIVAPGNSVDNEGNFFIGASVRLVGPDFLPPDLSGDRVAIRKLGSNLEILAGANPQISSWKTAPIPTDPALEWLRFSAGTPNSFINVDGNAANRFFVSNPNAGNAAVASIGARQIAGSPTTGVRIEVYGTGFTSTAMSLADGASVFSDTALSGGLTLGALAGDMRFFTSSSTSLPIMTLGATSGLTLRLAQSVTPANNGDTTICAASNTSMIVRHKGGDGTVRSVTLTLA